MFLNLTVENFASFKHKTSINLCKQVRKGEHTLPELVFECSETKCNPLRVAAFFGTNGAGKSNIIKAINYVKDAISLGVPERSQNISFFKNEDPISILTEFLIDDTIYSYHLSVKNNNVIAEELKFKKKNKEEFSKLFARQPNGILINEEGNDNIGIAIATVALSDNSKLSLSTIARNQNLKKNIDVAPVLQHIENVYNFFKRDVWIIFPKSEMNYHNLLFLLKQDNVAEGSKKEFEEFLTQFLSKFDTGICSVRIKELTHRQAIDQITGNKEELLKIEDSFHTSINKSSEEDTIKYQSGVIKTDRGVFFVTYTGEEFQYSSFVTSHHMSNGEKELYHADASDGTKRLFELSIAFWEKTSPRVILIDELENSLHPDIVEALVEEFIYNDNKGAENQMLLATHESRLFDLSNIRKDGLFIVEKKPNSESIIKRFCDTSENIRFDNNIRKRYEAGIFGGTPNIL